MLYKIIRVKKQYLNPLNCVETNKLWFVYQQIISL